MPTLKRFTIIHDLLKKESKYISNLKIAEDMDLNHCLSLDETKFDISTSFLHLELQTLDFNIVIITNSQT